MGLIGSNHEPGRRGFGSEACDAKARDAQAALCRALCCGLFFIAFLASKPGSEVSNTEEPCDGDGTSHGEAERGPHALWLRWWVFRIPCGGLRGRVQFAFRCPVHAESAKQVMWPKSPQATVGTRGRVISPCV